MKKILLIFLILFLPSIVFGTDYYISPTGSDGAVGSLAAPWGPMPSTSVDKLGAGDTLYFRGGAYTETAKIDVDLAGVTLKAYPGETPVITSSYAGNPVLSFPSGSEGSTVDGLTLIRTAVGNYNVIQIADSHITIQNCDISNGDLAYDGGSGDGIRFVPGTDKHGVLIYNNIIHHIAENGFDTASHHVVVTGTKPTPDGGGSWALIIRGNEIYDTKSIGILCKGCSQDILIEQNKIHNCSIAAVGLGESCTGDVALGLSNQVINAVARNNYIYGASTATGNFGTAFVLKSVKDVYIYNNTSLLGGVTISRVEDDLENAAGVLLGNENIYVYNNLFCIVSAGFLFSWNQRDTPYADGAEAHAAQTLADLPATVKPTNLCLSYNTFVNLAAGSLSYKENNVDGSITWATFQTNNADLVVGSTQYADGNTTIKLDSITTGSEDLDLQADSPLINIGLNKWGSTSKNGVSKPAGIGMDIGAYEVNGGQIR